MLCRSRWETWRDILTAKSTQWHPWVYTAFSSWCLIHVAQLVRPVPASATLAAWPSCPITSSFATPMGSCTHATAPGWAQYGTTYQPIHSPELREREAERGNELGWRKMGASICAWLKRDGRDRGGCSICDSRHLCIYMWSIYLHLGMHNIYPTIMGNFLLSVISRWWNYSRSTEPILSQITVAFSMLL